MRALFLTRCRFRDLSGSRLSASPSTISASRRRPSTSGTWPAPATPPSPPWRATPASVSTRSPGTLRSRTRLAGPGPAPGSRRAGGARRSRSSAMLSSLLWEDLTAAPARAPSQVHSAARIMLTNACSAASSSFWFTRRLSQPSAYRSTLDSVSRSAAPRGPSKGECWASAGPLTGPAAPSGRRWSRPPRASTGSRALARFRAAPPLALRTAGRDAGRPRTAS